MGCFAIIAGTGFGFFDQVRGEVKGSHLCAERGEAAGCQPVATGNVQDVLTGPDIDERGYGGPAKDVQDVNKKPYTFLLISPRNLGSAADHREPKPA